MSSAFQPLVPPNLFEQEEHQVYDYTSERGVLACIKKWPILINDAERLLKDSQFNLPANRAVFTLMTYMSRMSQQYGYPLAFDRPAMLTAANSMGTQFAKYFLETTEGMEQVRWIELTESTVSIDGFLQYVHTVIDRAQRVAAMRQARQIMLTAGDLINHSGVGVLSGAGNALANMAMAAMPNAMQRLGDGSIPVSSTGLLPSVLPTYFRWLNGLQPGTLNMISARTGVGKSALLLAVAVELATRQGVPVLYLDSEMTRDQQHARAIANMTGIEQRELEKRKDDPAVQNARTALFNAPLHHVAIGGATSANVFNMMRQFRQLLGDRAGVIVLDYIKMPADADQFAKDFIVLGKYASDMKDEAGRLELPIIAGVQENRAALSMDQKQRANGASLGAVAGSDRISHVCDSVAALRNVSHDESGAILEQFGSRQDYTGNIEANQLRFNQVLHLVKNRHGPACEAGFPVYHRKGVNRFTELGDEERQWLHSGGKASSPAPRSRSRSGLPSVQAMRLVR